VGQRRDAQMGRLRANALERALHSEKRIGRAHETEGALRIGSEASEKERASLG